MIARAAAPHSGSGLHTWRSFCKTTRTCMLIHPPRKRPTDALLNLSLRLDYMCKSGEIWSYGSCTSINVSPTGLLNVTSNATTGMSEICNRIVTSTSITTDFIQNILIENCWSRLCGTIRVLVGLWYSMVYSMPIMTSNVTVIPEQMRILSLWRQQPRGTCSHRTTSACSQWATAAK